MKEIFAVPAAVPVPAKGRALIIDDDAVVAEMLSVVIEEQYEVQTADSGETGLMKTEQTPFDLILLDIEMPGINGYETVCRLRATKDSATTFDVPVIFVSSHDTLEERVKAYEAGGDDFITKPFDPEELFRKVAVAARLKAERDQLAKEKSDMQSMAMDIMASLGEAGALLKFMRESLACENQAQLADKVLSVMGDLGLDAAVQIRYLGGKLTRNRIGRATPLEESVFERTADLGRIFHFKSRLAINYPHVSLMVTNMPDESSMLAGRVRDNTAILAEAADVISETIALRHEAARRTESLNRVFVDSATTLSDLRASYSKQQGDTRLLLDELIVDVEKTYTFLELSDKQEEVLSHTMRESSEKVLALFEQGLDLDARFARILEATRQ